jgi:hypothetical protein
VGVNSGHHTRTRATRTPDTAGSAKPVLYPTQLCEMMQWWLQDTVVDNGVWVDRDLPVLLQDADNGSCGLTMVSTIVALARIIEDTLEGLIEGPFSSLWSNNTLFAVHCDWMQLFLRHHLFVHDTEHASPPTLFGYMFTNDLAISVSQILMTMVISPILNLL